MRKVIHSHLLLVAIPLITLFCGCIQNKHPPQAVHGRIDLSEWNFDADGPVALNGEWEIYWQRLYSPDDYSTSVPPEPTGFIPVPNKWIGQVINGVPITYRGYATFRLKVRLPADGIPLVIQNVNSIGARNVWVDGELLAAVGKMGESAQTTREGLGAPITHPVGGTDRERELVVQAANFNLYPHYGTFFKISIGKYEAFRFRNSLRAGIEILILGVLVFMGFYHAILFLFQRKARTYLYFSAICLLYGFWSAFNGSGQIYWKAVLINGASWLPVYYATDVLFYLLPPFMVMYVRSLFPRECSILAVRLSLLAGASWLAVKLLMHGLSDVGPFEVLARTMYHHTWRPFEIIFFAFVIYVIAVVIVAAIRQRPNAYFILGSLLLLLACGVHDFLEITTFHSTRRLLGFGFFGMILCQSFILARRFANAFSRMEQLSVELGEKNIALSRLDRIKDQFLASTSHELRTPLNGIIGLTESLIQGAAGKLPERAKANLAMIFSSSKRLAGLVGDILDFYRLRNRDIQIVKKPVDLHALVDLVLSVCRGLVGNNPLTLVNDIPEEIPPVEGDENRIQQILYNLVGNAIKFTHRGTVVVTATRVDAMVQVSVTDTGIGIPDDRIQRIFDAFEQVDASDSRANDGTGLGLSITRRLVALHGGDIRVESDVGRGSTFHFTLPVSDRQPDEGSPRELIGGSMGHDPEDDGYEMPAFVPAPASGPELSTPGREPYQVLIVDDDAVNRQVVANHLQLEQITFQTAADGMAALERIESGAVPQVVLLDIMMPTITGYDVCRRLREKFSPSELPIIMLTAKKHVADLVVAYEAGASDYLPKPFLKDELISRVKSHLELRQACATQVENVRLEKALVEQKQKREKARLRAERASLEKLRYQLNPHFILNALASIRGAVVSDRDTAREMVSHLAAYCRLTLSRGDVEWCSVRKEIELVKTYLAIEQVRLGNYFEAIIELAPDAGDQAMPAVILQPLVENAIKFGAATSPDRLDVRVDAWRRDGRLRFRVNNSGRWVDHGPGAGETSTGIGLDNVKERLAILFPGNHTFSRRADDGWVRIEIDIPAVPGHEYPLETEGDPSNRFA